jgi:hypothetical protein
MAQADLPREDAEITALIVSIGIIIIIMEDIVHCVAIGITFPHRTVPL